MGDVGRYGLAIIGGVAGAFFGNPWLGFTLGATLGGALFPEELDPVNAQGPRLGDLRVQTSTFGRGVPILLGEAVRVAGNLIWSTERQETEHTSTQDVGGKGSPPTQEVTQTTYTYSISCAIAIGEGPIVSIRKIWANGELIYDVGSNADLESYFTSLSLAAAVRVYPGSETQEPDPLIVAYEGDAPGYRGTAHIVLDTLQLARFNNNPPNLEFEVIMAGSDGPAASYIDSNNQFGSIASVSTITPSGNLLTWWTTQTSPFRSRFAILNPYNGQILRELAPVDLVASVWAGTKPATMNSRGDICFLNSAVTSRFMVWLTGAAPVELTNLSSNASRVWVDDQDRFIFAARDISLPALTQYRVWYIAPGTTTLNTLAIIPDPEVFHDLCLGWDGFCYVSAADGSGNSKIFKISLVDGSLSASSPSFTGANIGNLAVAGDGSIWHTQGFGGASDFEVWRLAPDFVTRTQIYDHGGTFTGVNNVYPARDWDNGDVLVAWGSSFRRYTGDGTLVTNYGSAVRAFGVRTDPRFPDRVYLDNQNGPTGGVNRFLAAERLTSVTSSSVTLASVLTTICARVGLSAADIDVSGLTATVRGYAIAQRMTAAAAIQPLLTAYLVDAFESAGKIKFVQRGSASVVTIPEADMGAHLSGEQRPDPQDEGRIEEASLPREIAVNYIDIDTDYQPVTQYARRITGRSANDVQITLPSVHTDDEARRIAESLLYEAWIARRTHDVPLSTKYTRIEPGDVITLALPEDTLEVRVVQKDEGQGLVKLKTVGYDASIYTQTLEGVAGPPGQSGISSPVTATLVLLDTALLQDQDDDYGFYAAGSALTVSGTWPGGKLFKGPDNINFADTGIAWHSAAVVGYATTRLADFGGGNVFDEGVATVTVSLISGELSSTTETLVLAGANAAYLGGEIIQFKTATLISAGTYTLTGMLRGRLGTGWAMKRHKPGETFVLLTTAALRRLTVSSVEVGSVRYYKGVTFGTQVLAAPTQSFSLAANCLRPVAPAWLGGGRNASGDLIISWDRSARKASGWNDAVDVPLDEPTESYEVDVFAGTTKTITAISQASDGVITSAAHGLSVGNVIFINSAGGMTPINDRVFTVGTVPTANTFTVGENTAGYPLYTSGGSIRVRGRPAIVVVAAETTTYTAAQQTTDYLSPQNPIFVSVQQMSSRVGRGYAASASI